MVARVSPTGLDPVKAREIISHWFSARHTAAIAFKEDLNPRFDPDARYEVAYEATFEPMTLDQARVEVWITTDGNASIGFERRKRIAERLGIRNCNDRFAAGHEPNPVIASGLVAVLDMIADGQVAIAPTVIPILGLISTRAVMVREAVESLVSRGYPSVSWLQVTSTSALSSNKNLVRFHKWT